MRREFDVVMAWSVDRLGQSLQDLVSFLGELRAKEVDLYLHQQGVDTTTPAGEALFQMLGVFAQFERALIRGRVHAGLARAVAQGSASVSLGLRPTRYEIHLKRQARAHDAGLCLGEVSDAPTGSSQVARPGGMATFPIDARLCYRFGGWEESWEISVGMAFQEMVGEEWRDT